MGNAHTINQTFDLLSLASLDTALKKAGVGWWAGPCPFCGGTDRFTLKQTVTGWRWFCRNCGGDRYQTSLDYIMARQSCAFPEALAWANNDPVVFTPDLSGVKTTKKTSTSPRFPFGEGPGERSWQSRALSFMHASASTLWTALGASALTWLRARGLTDDTLRRYRLGYNPQDTFEPLSEWGLPSPDDGKRHAVWLPRGIVIPCFEDDQLWYLKIRRPLAATSARKGEQKYIKVKGSQPGLFGAWNLHGAWLAVLTEGELDCLLLDQHAGDLAGVATLGSAADRIGRLDLSIWGKCFLSEAYILIAYDQDAPGAKGARALESFTERAIHISLPDLPGVKDITDYHLAGGDLADWLCRTVERLQLQI
jgi:DNA primase